MPLHIAQALELQIVATGIGRATQQKSALAVTLEVRLERIPAHERRKCHCITPVALERLDGVLLGRAADVAALAVKNDRNVRCGTANVLHQPLQLGFGTVGCKVGDLRLVGQRHIGRGIDNGRAKIKDATGIARKGCGQPANIRVQANTQQGLVALFGRAKHVKKSHCAYFCNRLRKRHQAA